MPKAPRWSFLFFAELGFCLFLGGVIGHVFDHWRLGILLGLTLYGCISLGFFFYFCHWLFSAHLPASPRLWGLWRVVCDTIYQKQRQSIILDRYHSNTINKIQKSTASLKEAVLMLNDQGKIDWSNKAAEDLLGCKAVQDWKKFITEFITQAHFSDYLKAGDFDLPVRVTSPLNARSYIEISISQVDHGKLFLICRDITRLHNLEQMRKDFVANLSHELRTPLTVIRGYLETMLDHKEPYENWQSALQQMVQQAERMAAMVGDLLLLSRLEVEDPNTDPDEIILAKLAQEMVQNTEKLLGPNHCISVTVAEKSRVYGNAKELYSAFTNLLTNAVRYSPKGGLISISWTENKTGGYFSISDQGIGIDPVHIPRLTERFYRVDKSRSIDTGGTGLGLAIVKHVLLRHQAFLKIKSAPNKGSTFTCCFPKTVLVANVANRTR